jgi:putative ABC transport system ATP-binding protein
MFIEVKDLQKIYKTEATEFVALNDINLGIEKGEICVILGPSGSGKSTLLNIIGGIDDASGGSVTADGIEVTSLNDSKLTNYRREKVGFIFQFYNLIPNLTVYENIEVVQNVSKNPLDIDELLDNVGLLEFKNRYPRELSGGQQQRVSIVRALVKNPSLLLCDEPTGALDFKGSKDILKLICEVNKKYGTTVLIITHNNAIAGIANRIVKLRGGELTENHMNNEIISAEMVEW